MCLRTPAVGPVAETCTRRIASSCARRKRCETRTERVAMSLTSPVSSFLAGRILSYCSWRTPAQEPLPASADRQPLPSNRPDGTGVSSWPPTASSHVTFTCRPRGFPCAPAPVRCNVENKLTDHGRTAAARLERGASIRRVAARIVQQRRTRRNQGSGQRRCSRGTRGVPRPRAHRG